MENSYFFSHLYKFISCLAIPIFLLMLLIVILLISPFHLLRAMLSVLAKSIRPELEGILDMSSAMMANDGIYTSPPRSNIVISCVLDGIRDQKWWKNTVLAIPEITNEEGNIKYPELKQYIEMWLGYPFWRKDESFNINNHLSFQEVDSFNYSDITKFLKDASLLPYKAKHSPWEFIVISGLQDEDFPKTGETKTLLLFRIHHALVDGLSVTKLWINICNNVGGKVHLNSRIATRKQKRSIRQALNIKNMSSYIFSIIKTSLRLAYDNLISDEKYWSLKDNDFKLENFCVTSSKISCSDIKLIKNKLEVRFMSVVLAAMTAAIRKACVVKSMAVPKRFHIFYPTVRPGHPDKLCNHAAMSSIWLPTGEENSLTRLKLCEKTLLLSEKLYPPENVVLLNIFGALPECIVKHVLHSLRFGTGLSYSPGPLQSLNLNGLNMSDWSYIVGNPRHRFGFGFMIMSYAGGLRITLEGNKGFVSNELDFQQIVQALANEISILKSEAAI